MNDEENRNNSQRVLFSIYSYSLRRWLKLAVEQSVAEDTVLSPCYLVLFTLRRHYTIAGCGASSGD